MNIHKGERLILTGRDDGLHLRLEKFLDDPVAPRHAIDQRIPWDMLHLAVTDIQGHCVDLMRARLVEAISHTEKTR